MLTRRRSDAIFVGTETATSQKIHLAMKWLKERHLHVIGPPGEGKSRWLLNLFMALCRIRGTAVVLVNLKGALGRMARDFVLGNGLTPRLVWFDPNDGIGYNPLRPNGLAIHAHAKAVRESIRSAWGQDSFDQTPRLARYLYLALALARTFEWGLTEALEILRPGARLRREILPNIIDPFLKSALAALDAMTVKLQEERTESCISRLEAFVSDPVIASMLTAPQSLDIGQVIADHKILIVNLEIRRPLTLDDVKLMVRMLINDIGNHILAQPTEDTFIIIDECHLVLTHDFCQLLDMGREVGAHVIAAHQNLDQLRQEDESGRIYGSVMKCARVKAIFGDCAADDLDVLLRDAMIDGYDNMKVKNELTSLELEPVESRREVTTNGWSLGASIGLNKGSSSSTAQTKAVGVSHGNSRQWGGSSAHSDTHSFVHSSGVNSGMANGETMLPNGEIITIANATEGASQVDTFGTASADSFGEFQSEGEQHSVSETQSGTTANGTQTGFGIGFNGSFNHSSSAVPFYEYIRRRNVSSRTFESEQEFLTKCLQKVKSQPVGHFLLKLPKRSALFLRAPFVPEPKITERRKIANLERMFAQPFYESRNSRTVTDAVHTTHLLPAPEIGNPPTATTYRPRTQMVEFSELPPTTFREEK